MFHLECRRDAVAVSGSDAATYLQSQLSQDLRSLDVAASTWSLVLTPTGRVDALVRVYREADSRFVLDIDEEHGHGLLARLQRFCIRVDVTFELESLPIVAVRGGTPPECPPDALVAWGDGVDLLAGRPETPDVLVAVPAGTDDDLLLARIEACWPAMGAEIIPGETVPAETGVLSQAVSFTKGCYPGQELVERMDSRGAAAPWRLEAVDVALGLAAGDALERNGTVVGTLTSVSGTRAIARVRRTA